MFYYGAVSAPTLAYRETGQNALRFTHPKTNVPRPYTTG